MNEEILEEYEKIKDKISIEEFQEKMNEESKKYDDASFITNVDIARMIVGTFVNEKNEIRSEKPEHQIDNISKLEEGIQNNIIGRIIGISNSKIFKSRKGKEGKLCNMRIADDTGEIRVVLWTENIKLLKNLKEGDIIQINRVDIKQGYREKEAHLQPRSTIKLLDSKDFPNFPEYSEPITAINDIVPDTQVNIIARIIRIPRIRTFERNGKEGEVISIELQDESGKISYTLWNKDVNLIETLELSEGDSVKILSAQARERNGEISLSHWEGRIIKGDYDVPEYEDNILKITEAHEVKDITLMGIITKIQDTITFERADGTEGSVKSIELADDTGSIKVTLWGDDTNLEINKADIIKIIGGNIEFDEYSTSGYKVNTNWNTRILINPHEETELINVLNEYKSQIGPIKIEEVQEIEEDGVEVDIIGRLITVNNPTEFQRDDGTLGIVRSANFADETGMVRLSFWDDKAQENLEPGTAFQIENARTKMGMYAVDLNIGKSVRVIKLSEEDAKMLPSFETLEEMIYTHKKIMDLEEDNMNIRVIGIIMDVSEPREFQKSDGSPGVVRNIEIADDTGFIRSTLWDDDANIPLKVGEGIKIENPRINFNNDRLELNITNSSKILTPTDKELDDLPTIEELQSILYKSKTIEALEDNDFNVRITGTLKDPYGNKILLTKCPFCNNNLEENNEEYICDYCGEDVEEPKYILMIPGRFEDETGEISITFFSKLAEELLDMTLDEVVQIVNDSGDLGVLEGKVEDIDGITLEIIADVSFDEYNEENRLNPKKIISKSL